jgi:Flp pilus assembly protein TadD
MERHPGAPMAMTNLTILFAATVLGAAAPWALSQAQSKPANRTAADAAETPAAKLKALQAEVNDARNAWMAEYQKISETEKAAYVKDHPYPEAKEALPKAWKLVEANPKDPASFAALRWIMGESRGGADFGKALEMIARDHMSDPKIGEVCQMLVYESSEKAEKFLDSARKSPDVPVQAIANYALARNLLERASTARHIAENTDPKMRESYEKFLGAEEFANIQKADPKKLSARGEELLEQCVENKDFASVALNRSTVGESAKSELHEIRDLAIDKIAPEISGEDINGVAFKLSDYRGKVVVLDFWGNW